MVQSIQVNNLSYRSMKSYAVASLFVLANIALPQLFHLFNLSGVAYLPIILFTMVGVMVYGRSVGMITAIASPLISYAILGMPSLEMSVVVMAKGLAFAAVLGYYASKNSKISLLNVITAIVAYQVVGFAISAIVFSFDAALESMVISYKAVILQLLVATILMKLKK
ncbi:MAG: hypothetical protein R3Y50_09705 [Rikenellaceae bacterium]